MAWRYCGKCGTGQNRITFDQIWRHASSSIQCNGCGIDRADDTPEERMEILVDTVKDLLDIIEQARKDNHEKNQIHCSQQHGKNQET